MLSERTDGRVGGWLVPERGVVRYVPDRLAGLRLSSVRKRPTELSPFRLDAAQSRETEMLLRAFF